MASRYKTWYNTVVRPDLMTKLQLKNVHQVPALNQISVSASTHVVTSGLDHPVAAAFALELITGRAAELTYIKQGRAEYKVRQGMLEGGKVVLKGNEMYNFLDRLVTQVCRLVHSSVGYRRLARARGQRAAVIPTHPPMHARTHAGDAAHARLCGTRQQRVRSPASLRIHPLCSVQLQYDCRTVTAVPSQY